MLSPLHLAIVIAPLTMAVSPIAQAGAPSAVVGPATAITLHRGEPGSVELQTNASTGYGWKVDADRGIDVTLIKTIPTRPGMVGAPSIATYRILGRKRGSYRIVFRYMRPWEGKAVRTLRYRVRIV